MTGTPPISVVQDATTAQTIPAKLDAKYRSKTPIPGSEAALRRVIDGVRAGKPNYEEMTPSLAETIKQLIASTSAFKPYSQRYSTFDRALCPGDPRRRVAGARP